MITSRPDRGGEVCRAFVPRPLPPGPPLVFDSRLLELHNQALVAVGGRASAYDAYLRVLNEPTDAFPAARR